MIDGSGGFGIPISRCDNAVTILLPNSCFVGHVPAYLSCCILFYPVTIDFGNVSFSQLSTRMWKSVAVVLMPTQQCLD